MEFVIEVGGLNSLPALNYNLGIKLAKLNNSFRSGLNPTVIWDLRTAVPKFQNIASLVALLATAKAVSDFTGRPSKVIHKWNPQILSFWHSISFIQTSEDLRIFEWDRDRLVGFPIVETNTKILHYPFIGTPRRDDRSTLNKWKDETRPALSADLTLRARSVFRNADNVSAAVKHEIAIATAELIVNSILHGNSDAFVGLQQTRNKITIGVCDAGVGFLRSLLQKPIHAHSSPSDLDALLTGCLFNRSGVGLRGAIDLIVNTNGTAIVSSYRGEIRWRIRNWSNALKQTANIYQNDIPTLIKSRDLLGPAIRGTADQEVKKIGYHREWPHRLVGSRIEFEIPLANH